MTTHFVVGTALGHSIPSWNFQPAQPEKLNHKIIFSVNYDSDALYSNYGYKK